jgi:hypothetical protein
MILGITGFLDFSHRLGVYIQENATFQKLDRFPKRRVFLHLEFRTTGKVEKPHRQNPSDSTSDDDDDSWLTCHSSGT